MTSETKYMAIVCNNQYQFNQSKEQDLHELRDYEYIKVSRYSDTRGRNWIGYIIHVDASFPELMLVTEYFETVCPHPEKEINLPSSFGVHRTYMNTLDLHNNESASKKENRGT